MSAAEKSPLLANEPVFARLKELVIKATGLAYYQQKDADLAEKLTRRMTRLGLVSGADYLYQLTTDQSREELDHLIAELTIGETYFFRHVEQFDVLKNTVFPDVLARNQSRKALRIWSAGASIGAEAYSLGIMLKQEFSGQLEGWSQDIVGTDINRAYLAQASSGIFHAWALRSITDSMRHRCFIPAVIDGTQTWQVRPEYRQGVRFQQHNLCTSPFPSAADGLVLFDVILCRNVMIYFDQPTIQRLLEQFALTLAPGGWLLLGSSEISTGPIADLKLHHYQGAAAYQKSLGMSEPVPTLKAPAVPLHSQSPSDLPPARLAPKAVATAAPTLRSLSSPVPMPVVSTQTSVDSAPTLEGQLQTLRSLADQGESKPALLLCAKLVASYPVDARIHFLEALLHVQAREDTAAEAALRRVIYLDRKFILAHYQLGLLLKRRGNQEKADQYLRNAARVLRELSPTLPLPEGRGLRVQDLLKTLAALGVTDL